MIFNVRDLFIFLGLICFVTQYSHAQENNPTSLVLTHQNIVSDDTNIDEDLPEEPEEELSELELMILKEIGKALSFEERKATIYNLISEAKTYLGTPYVYGGTQRTGIDCSAFMQRVYAAQDIKLPRVSRNQALLGFEVAYDDIEMGDMIFFSNSPTSRISHVGMVVEVTTDNIYFIHAGSSTGVTISPLSMNYWKKRFRYAKRVFGETDEEVLAKS